jgi:hypothetical protein
MAKADTKPKPKKLKATDKQQSERFMETARKLGTNQSMEEFERTFKKIVPPNPITKKQS